ncbi:MAG TPA: PaaI family thioesterase [Actinomycetota bacterium]
MDAGVTPEEALGVAVEMSRGTLMERLGMEWVELTAQRVVIRMPVEGNTQPFGLLHGGATAALCETVGSIGTSIHVGLERIPVGIQLSVNHLRAVRTGKVTATGVPVHIGRTTALWDILVEDDEGRRVAAGRLTLAIRDATPGARS